MNPQITSKPRYDILDGLRGVAIAQLALTFYDKPVRKWLSGRK